MNSAIRRVQGLSVALVVMLAMGAVGTTTASAAPAAQVSGLTAKQKKAKTKALKKCNRKRPTRKKKACMKQVVKKYREIARRQHHRPPPARIGKTWTVDVRDSYFDPDQLQLKTNDWIAWTWQFSTVREGHNVNVSPPFPNGVIATDIQSQTMTGPGGRFKRQFTKPGMYDLYCNLHLGMTMTVQVSK